MTHFKQASSWGVCVAAIGLAGCQVPTATPGGGENDGSLISEGGPDAPAGPSEDAAGDRDGSAGSDASAADASGDATVMDAMEADALLADSMPPDGAPAEAALADAPSSDDGSSTTCLQGQTRCGTTCADVATDSQNCGLCGHDCSGGPCCDGWCQATLVVNTAGTPAALAADSANIYWSELNDGPAFINECGIAASCVPTTLVSGDSATTTQLVASGSNLYWAASNLFECAIGGCGGVPTSLADLGTERPTVTVDATNLYWSDGYDPGDVYECPLDACPGSLTTLGWDSLPVGAIAVNGSDAFWTTTSFIGTCPIGSSCGNSFAQPVVYSPQVIAEPLAVDSTNLYWFQDGSLFTCPIADCSAHTVTLAQNVAPFGIAIDATTVYWGDYAAGGSILSCAKGGCTAPNVLASGLAGLGTAQAFAMNATSLYVATEIAGGSGLIARVAKPTSQGPSPPAASCSLTVPSTFIGFPNCQAGVSSQTFTITNGEAVPVTFSAAFAGGSSFASQLSIAPSGATLAPMQSVTITITPTVVAHAPVFPFPIISGDTELVITPGGGGLPERVEVGGSFAPNVDFGDVPIHSSVLQMLPQGPSNAPAGSGWFFSADNPAFTLSPPVSDAGVGADWSVTFAPTAPGTQSAIVEYGSPATPICPLNPIVLTGNGT